MYDLRQVSWVNSSRGQRMSTRRKNSTNFHTDVNHKKKKKKKTAVVFFIFSFRTNAVGFTSGAERVIKENTLASKLQLRLHLRMKSMSYSRPLNTSYPKCLNIEIELVTNIIFTPPTLNLPQNKWKRAQEPQPWVTIKHAHSVAVNHSIHKFSK